MEKRTLDNKDENVGLVVEEENDIPSGNSDRIEEILIQMQELEIKMEQTEIKIVDEVTKEKYMPDYIVLSEQYDELKSELKVLRKEMRQKTIWDKIPLWMIVYAVIQFFITFPFVSSVLWTRFAQWIIKIFEKSLNNVASSGNEFFIKTLLVLIIYSLPLLNLLLTWLINNNFVKKELNKKIFKYIWIGQGILTLGTMIWLYFTVVKDIL